MLPQPLGSAGLLGTPACVCSPAWSSSVGHNTTVQRDTTTFAVSLHQHGWPGRDEGGLAAATTGHRSSHRDGAASHIVVPLCGSKGMDGGRSRRTVADVSVAAGGPAGPFALTLQTGRSLPGAGCISHHDLIKNPCSGIFFQSCVGPWRGVGGSTAPFSLRGVADVGAAAFLSLPLPTSQTAWDLALAPRKSLGHSRSAANTAALGPGMGCSGREPAWPPCF